VAERNQKGNWNDGDIHCHYSGDRPDLCDPDLLPMELVDACLAWRQSHYVPSSVGS